MCFAPATADAAHDYPASMRRPWWIWGSLAAVALLVAGAGAAWWIVHRPTPDVHRGAELPFTLTSNPPPTAPTAGTSNDHPAWGAPWPTYGRTMARTRDASDLTTIVPPYRHSWSEPSGFLEYPPSYARGVLYVTTNLGTAVARSAFTGKLVWRRDMGTPIRAEPTVLGNRIYFGGYDGNIYAIRAGNGSSAWTTHVGAQMESPPAAGGGRLYVSDLGGHMRALDATTGRVLWTLSTSGAVKHGPALVDGRLYFGDYAGVMYCVRASDGHVIWRTSTHGLSSGFRSGTFFSTPSVAYGRVYIGNTDHKVYAFEASNGQVAWTYTMPDWAYGSPAVSAGRVFTTSWDGTFVALSARTGALLWRHKLAGNTISSPTVIGPYVYVADRGAPRARHGDLYAYNVGDGHMVWSFPDGRFSTVVVGAGRLFVAGPTRIYALRPMSQ
jgi:outer membrane protein assembly factor BamB